MQQREGPIARADDVALVDDPRRRDRPHLVQCRVVSVERERVDQDVGRDLVGSRQHRDVLRFVRRGHQRAELPPSRDRVRIVAMHDDLVELVQAADVVVVPMRRHGDDGPFEEVGELLAKRRDAEPRVDQQVAIAPTDEEQVRADQWTRVRLGDPKDAVVDLVDREPAIGDRQRAHGWLPAALTSNVETMRSHPAAISSRPDGSYWQLTKYSVVPSKARTSRLRTARPAGVRTDASNPSAGSPAILSRVGPESSVPPACVTTLAS